jgi:hypothetical protein
MRSTDRVSSRPSRALPRCPRVWNSGPAWVPPQRRYRRIASTTTAGSGVRAPRAAAAHVVRPVITAAATRGRCVARRTRSRRWPVGGRAVLERPKRRPPVVIDRHDLTVQNDRAHPDRVRRGHDGGVSCARSLIEKSIARARSASPARRSRPGWRKEACGEALRSPWRAGSVCP